MMRQKIESLRTCESFCKNYETALPAPEQTSIFLTRNGNIEFAWDPMSELEFFSDGSIEYYIHKIEEEGKVAADCVAALAERLMNLKSK